MIKPEIVVLGFNKVFSEVDIYKMSTFDLVENGSQTGFSEKEVVSIML